MGACTQSNNHVYGDAIVKRNTVDNLTFQQRVALEKNFKGAMKGKTVENLIFKKLDKLGFSVENTLFADSSCPDEINHDDPDNSITSLFQQRWGEIFSLSGLAGVPFAGTTGWGAFSSHCPKDGNIVVLYAPHVGIDQLGSVGNVMRHGIEHTTTACGAAIGAYNAVKSDPSQANFKNGYMDHQMDCIKHMLLPYVKNIKGTENEMATLSFKMFEIIEDYLEDILHLDWQGPNSKLALIGGIMVNCGGEGTDRFLPLKFEIRCQNVKLDLFEEVFGPKVHQQSCSGG